MFAVQQPMMHPTLDTLFPEHDADAVVYPQYGCGIGYDYHLLLSLVALYCRPVQDSECGQLKPGVRVVVLAKWPNREEQKYYDAEIVSADRKQHSAGECCTHPSSVYRGRART